MGTQVERAARALDSYHPGWADEADEWARLIEERRLAVHA